MADPKSSSKDSKVSKEKEAPKKPGKTELSEKDLDKASGGSLGFTSGGPGKGL